VGPGAEPYYKRDLLTSTLDYFGSRGIGVARSLTINVGDEDWRRMLRRNSRVTVRMTAWLEGSISFGRLMAEML
jgi:hypothetical protein